MDSNDKLMNRDARRAELNLITAELYEAVELLKRIKGEIPTVEKSVEFLYDEVLKLAIRTEKAVRLLRIEILETQMRTMEDRGEADGIQADLPYAGYSSYDEYLQSPYWQETRKRILERAGHRCSVCNIRSNLNVHHNNYKRLGEERDEDVIVLCEECHRAFHEAGNSYFSDPI